MKGMDDSQIKKFARSTIKKKIKEKDELNMVGDLCGILTYPCSTPLPNSVAILKKATSIPCVGLCFWRGQSRPCCQGIVFVYFNYLGVA